MSASGKFDLSSSSPDRPLYGPGQRGSFTAASTDRLSSFRENMENPILSSLPSMSRSTPTVTQGNVINFLHCLRFDPKAMASDHKFNRQGDFRRLASVALGAPDDSPTCSSKGKLPSSSPEELKRLKASLRESTIKARERVKIFSESLLVINKCFPSIPSRKRSRPDVMSGERSVSSLNDRSVLSPSVSKSGTQNHGISSSFDFKQQKLEERVKNVIPNKRTRTSMVDQRMDGRPPTPARSSGNVDRDKDMLRLPNNSAVQGEDRALNISVDGWEKSKMKKKRSGMKADIASGPSTVKSMDGYREPKQGMHPRLISDPRSRLNDSFGSRPGVVNGSTGIGKADSASQQMGSGIRSSLPRAEPDCGSLPPDKRDRAASSEKERTHLRAVNKACVREEFNSASPTSSGKLHANARGPRSGSGIVTKLSPVIQRATAANDWEFSNCTNKTPGAVGPTNRKRATSARSSSPPVGQWADRRPQKMSRTARRTNFVNIVPGNDETPPLDAVSDVTGSENGSAFARRFPGNSPQQVKLKGDNQPSTTLSESEESGAGEIKSREKGKKSDEGEEKVGQIVQKAATPVMAARKNRLINGEDLVDGIRRQGRTGRGFTSARSLMPQPVEKLGSVGTAKQLRSVRLGFDKGESVQSRSGRPPTRKLTDRKGFNRQKQASMNATADFIVGSDDGHEELLASANAVINPSRELCPFWKKKEPYFGFLSEIDLVRLKQQACPRSTAATPTLVPLEVDSFSTFHNGFGPIESVRNTKEIRSFELSPEHLSPETTSPFEIPLCQRLLASLISEDGNEEPSCSESEDVKFNVYYSEFELETDVEAGLATFNSSRRTSRGRSCNEFDRGFYDNVALSTSDTTIPYGFDHLQNGVLPDASIMPVVACSEYEYGNMSINRRIFVEIQSIGLCPGPMPDLAPPGKENIGGDIKRLEDEYQEKVSWKRSLLDKLLKSTNEARELDEKEFERRCLDKLVTMAYQKYMNCWGSSGHGKSAGSKMAKQAALAFVKRTLGRCQEFEVTGKSCFSEPLFKEMIRSLPSHLNDTQPSDAIPDGECGKFYGTSIEVRASGPQLSPSTNNDIYSSYPHLSGTHFSEPNVVKEDSWSNRVKKRELDDVVAGTAGTGVGTTLLSSAKGKRSERDREGKGNSREISSRNGPAKIGRPPSSGNVKGERKSKTKPKQKTTQLSTSVIGLFGKISEQPKVSSPMPKPNDMAPSCSSGKGKNECMLDVFENTEEPIDLSNLQLPEMDVLGVGDNLGDQVQDIGSWLNIDDDGLQDDDFMGLEIPMDDLADLNMMV